MRHTFLLTATALLMLNSAAVRGQDNSNKQDPSRTLTSSPEGFDAKREGIDRGKLETIEYDSKTVGAKRKAQV